MFFSKYDRLKEADFQLFRIPFESKRQSPDNFRKVVYGMLFAQAFPLFFNYLMLTENTDRLGVFLIVLIILSCILSIIWTILALIFTRRKVYVKRQVTQYLITSMLAFDFMMVTMFVNGVSVLAVTSDISEKSLKFLVVATIVLILAVFFNVLSWLTRSIQKGDYRLDSDKHDYRELSTKERQIPRTVSKAIGPTVGTLYILHFIWYNVTSISFSAVLAVTISLLIPYLAAYAFCFTIVNYYCKKRFKSFNFDENGELYEFGSGDALKGDYT